MRMRRKPWARPELAVCPFFIQNPSEYIGKWNTIFEDNSKPIYMELGCGKGGFISQIAPAHPEINFLALDIKSEMLALANRKLQAEYEALGKPIDNVKIMAQNIEQIHTSFGENDSIDRIYINFCNPWPKKKHKKRRLTYPRQLEQYKVFLKKNAEIRFKTDDDELFEESLEYFKDCGFEITYLTRDLHNSDFTENYVTEHENMFSEMGINIKFLIAKNVG